MCIFIDLGCVPWCTYSEIISYWILHFEDSIVQKAIEKEGRYVLLVECRCHFQSFMFVPVFWMDSDIWRSTSLVFIVLQCFKISEGNHNFTRRLHPEISLLLEGLWPSSHPMNTLCECIYWQTTFSLKPSEMASLWWNCTIWLMHIYITQKTRSCRQKWH